MEPKAKKKTSHDDGETKVWTHKGTGKKLREIHEMDVEEARRESNAWLYEPKVPTHRDERLRLMEEAGGGGGETPVSMWCSQHRRSMVVVSSSK
jgi:hypothetical protein